jgi:predicted component of type VI protein secretion system
VVQLQILNGTKAGTRWVAGHLPFSVGRSPDDDLRLEDPGVWEHHCHIELRDDSRAALVGSPEALTVINGQRVQEAVLRNGDVLDLGSIRLQFGLSSTRHRSLRLREWLTWFGLALLSLAQIGLIYLLSENL